MNLRVSILFLAALTVPAVAEERVNYLKEIKPLLSGACYQCHSETQQKGGLRLDTGANARKGGEKGAVIVPGKSDESLLIKAVMGVAKDMARMPYKKSPLDDEKIALLKKWIDEGASSPTDEKAESVLHWAFVPPPSLIAVPVVKQKKWTRNEIDRFILDRLEKQNIKPSPEADRITLIRRVSLDLTGLPPKIAEVDEFVKDQRHDAYEKLVERLLNSKHYGERWGRHWLDAARYADSNGYSVDAPRQIWKYRDWVIDAFNRDLPFDEFTMDQLAGDLRLNPTLEQKIATGFHRNTQINQEGGIDKEQFRIESIVDRVNTTAGTWLGLTVGCAQCHDHKFDPIAQKEYYQLFAFLNNQEEPDLEVASSLELEQMAKWRQEITDAESELKSFVDSAADEVAAWQKALSPEEVAKLKTEITTVLEMPPDKRTLKEKLLLVDQVRKDNEEYQKKKGQLAKLEKSKPDVTSTMVLQERSEPRESYLFIKGDFTRLGEVVTPGVPKVLPPLPAEIKTPNRLNLAQWLMDPKNPLPARVTVNRMWMQYFAKGIVETENDFGTQGSGPSHPELLDWLANEFIKQKWSQKAMHRLIVTSATYRQSSRARPDLKTVDPYNKLFARQNRFRLDAEVVRDVELAASGLLNDQVGGPSVFPPIPDGVMTLGQNKREWKTSEGPTRYRRGMYTFFYRATPPPGLMVFDAPETTSTCTRRLRSNTPLQSLTLLNDAGFVEFAQGLALRVLNDVAQNDEARIDYAFKLCLSREPKRDEQQRLKELLNLQLKSYDTTPEEAKTLLPKTFPADTDVKQLAAWTTVSRVLLNLDETITRE
ncbi:MAG: PSD1 and planctomycete cytochrome C domain-containing protein [Verrucomicrobiota bacterium]